MGYRVGVDIGGTFTDFAVLNEDTNEISTLKVLSNPSNPGAEILLGLQELQTRSGIDPSDVKYFTHGTTVGINSVIQRNGPKLALFFTENFLDVLELARLRMPDFYDLLSRRPDPLVTRDFVFPISERTRADGKISVQVDEESVRQSLRKAIEAGAEGIVVSFLHSYRNPANELLVKALIIEAAPDMAVCCSSEVWPSIREYERTTTAIIHAYVQPRISRYLTSLQHALLEAGLTVPPMVTKSNGGVMSAELGKSQSIQMLLSGTASGVIGASFVARHSGFDKVMSLDIGGTSADVALITAGQPEFRTGELVGDFPIYIPTVSVSSIGQGGGSIASVNTLGVLSVGPKSAGSTPGPVCYGRGGNDPTITDALVVMGFIGEAPLGYGAVDIDVMAARAAIGTIAAALSLSVESAAEAILQVAISGMYREVSKLVSSQGGDPTEFTLLAFGGAGPMMACWLARELGVKEVLVPFAPGVLSALGGLVADVKNDFIRSIYLDLNDIHLGAIQRTLEEIVGKAKDWIIEEQRFQGPTSLLVFADMRYSGQSFEIEISLDPNAIRDGRLQEIGHAFHDRHLQIYGHADEAAAMQIINLRVVVVGETIKPALPRYAMADCQAKPLRMVQVHCDGERRTIPLFTRASLLAGHGFDGPAIVVQDDTTTCVPPRMTGRVDLNGNLLLSLQD